MRGLEVRRARNGKGIFVVRNFRSGEILFPIQGKVLHYTITNKKPRVFQNNTYRYGPNTYVSPEGYLGDFLNHSCEPNSRVVKKDRVLYVVALRSLKKGEEVLIDYSTIQAKDDVWKMVCNCGAKTCRHTIGVYARLPRETLERYIRQHVIPRYILNIPG